MSRRKLAWMAATKVAFTVALMLPARGRDTVEYRTLSALSGVRAGTPVVLSGLVIGHVAAKNRGGDTTVLRVRFDRGAEQLPGSRLVGVRWMGLGQDVALEIQPGPRRGVESFARGGWLQVIPLAPFAFPQPEVARTRALRPEEPPWRPLIPTTPAAPRRLPPAST
jgi:hypothetical protein